MTDETMSGLREDDLRLLMTVALVGGRRQAPCDYRAIFEAWQAAYPRDALGPLCIGLDRYTDGDHADGLALIATAAQADTRAEQARDILADFDPSHPLASQEHDDNRARAAG